jgi:formate-dependent nitrite reductase membrane component NrfD
MNVRETISTKDGRNVDPELGRLLGEGSLQRARPITGAHDEPFHALPTKAAQQGTYYGLPLLKEPVWKWMIPAYFYAGGVAGAAAALGAAAQLARVEETGALVRRCRFVAAGGVVTSAALLIADLGRPERFLNMLRVFRPTSPMNMGTWILSAFGAMSTAAAAAALWPSSERLRRLGDLTAIGAGIVGLPLCTYTGVLIANTAVPIWQGTRRALPILFGAAGAAGAGAVLELFPATGAAEAIVHRFGVAGKACEIALTVVLEREAAAVPRVARPLRRGASGALWRASQALSVAGLVLSWRSLGRPGLRRAAGILGTLGAVSLRLAVMKAGRASARDPRATVAQQRAGRGAGDVVRERGRAGASLPAWRGEGAGVGMEHVGRDAHE